MQTPRHYHRQSPLAATAVGACACAIGLLGLLPSASAQTSGERTSKPDREGFALPSTPKRANDPTVSETKVRFDLLGIQPAVRAGETLEVILRFRMPPKWHIYWRGLNDTGLPPTWTIELPPAWASLVPQANDRMLPGELAPQLWPAPTRYVSSADTVDAAYFDELLLVQSLAVPAGLAPGDYELAFHASWLVCDDACIPEDGSASTRVQVLAADAKGDATNSPPRVANLALVVHAHGLRPTPLTPEVATNEGITAKRLGSTVTLEASTARSIAFLPSDASLPFTDLLTTGEAKQPAGDVPPKDAPAPLRLTLQLDADLANGMRTQLKLPEGADALQVGNVEGVVLVTNLNGVTKSYWLSLPAIVAEDQPAK